jgi:hypothetical protein
MAHNISDLMLEGDVAALLLQHVFAPDITLARIRCAGCDCTSGVGGLATHAAPMGTTLKCSNCDHVLMRVVDAPRGLLLEMVGARYLRFEPATRPPALHEGAGPSSAETQEGPSDRDIIASRS